MMGDTYRVLVTGSRDWVARDAVWGALKEACDEHGTDNVVIVHGDARGADSLAQEYAYLWNISCERHPARWNDFGKRAGFRRNAEMVALGADVCLAFISPCTKPGCQGGKPHGSHGATHCAALAEAAGIPVRRFTP